MKTRLFASAFCAKHNPGKFHPEHPARLFAIKKAIEALPSFRQIDLDLHQSTVSDALLTHVHSSGYIEALKALAQRASQPILLDPDTVLMRGTLPAACAAAQSGVDAVDAVLAGQTDNAFCLSRPPGHHARHSLAMGFCFINNIAIAAARALETLEKVVIVDFDAHHGNGTEEWARRIGGQQVSYFSLHEESLWPVTGTQSEGNVTNVPLKPGTGGKTLREAFAENVIGGIKQAQPDLILISAGFDAHKGDDAGSNLAFTTQDYGWMTDRLRIAAEECCDGRMVSMLEGGYNLTTLAQSAAAHIQALQGVWQEQRPSEEEPEAFPPPLEKPLLKHITGRLKRGIPSGLYIEMLERRTCTETDCQNEPPWIGALWEQNKVCLGNWLQESLRRADQGQALLARQALHYVFAVVRTIKASPFAFVADQIPGISSFCDPDDPKATEHYERAALDRRDSRFKALAKSIRTASLL